MSSPEHALDFMGLEWHSEWQWGKVKTDQTNIKTSELIVFVLLMPDHEQKTQDDELD